MLKATREQTKEHNSNLVLRTIYHQGDISRAEVARITGLTRTTVSTIVDDLMAAKLLQETGQGTSAGGKPPILLNVNDDAQQLICLDLSSAVFRGALVNLRGKIHRQAFQPGLEEGQASPLEAIYSLVDELIAAADAPLLGIGIGTPGVVEGEKGVVRRSVHLQWTDLPLKDLLENRYHLPAYVINDSHAAALAEYTFGELRGTPNLIVVKIGEGVGAGIILSGRLHYGDGFGAGEIGHLTVVEGGRQCTCGNYGCLETIASTQAIVQRLQELAEYDWISFSTNPAYTSGEISWDFVRQAFEAGDETVTELVKEAGRYLGVSVANLISILNIQRIVISGSFVDFGATFLKAMNGEVKRRALASMAMEAQLEYSSLGANNVILGATALILANEMGLP